MAKEDWYRNKKWNDQIKKQFFEKLSRARSQRDQYLTTQAGVLCNNGYHKEALELIDLYFETRKDDFHDISALIIKADTLFKLKRVKEAVCAYHELLKLDEEHPGIDSGYRIKYPYIAATHQIQEEYDFALKTLDGYKEQDRFPLQSFMRYAVKGLINENPEAAKTALEIAKVKKSGMKYHQELGLVGKEHNETIRRLIKIKHGSIFDRLKSYFK